MGSSPRGERETNVIISAFIRFTPSSLAVSIVALKDIEPGEEITITYVPMGQTREERRAGLLKWGFNCNCSLCTASKAEVAASDYRRKKIKQLRQEVMEAVEAWDGKMSIDTLVDLGYLENSPEALPALLKTLDD